MVTVNSPGDRWPRSLDGKNSLLSVTLDQSSSGRVKENRLDTEERQSSRSRLGLGRSRKRTTKVKTVVSFERL